MVSSPSSRLNFYDESGAKIPFPVEGRKCGIIIDVPKEHHKNVVLKLDTTVLPVHTQGSSTCAYSVWPATGPGNYNLSLACADIREHRTITIVPQHFTEADFKVMITDLTDVLPKSIVSKLVQCGAQLHIEQGRADMSSIEEEWYKLRDAITGTEDKLGLLQILPIIQRECNQILLPRLEVKPADKLRRPELSRLPQAMSMPGNMIAEDELYQMFDVTVEQSFETYENQLVKTYVQAIRSQLAKLQTKVTTSNAPPEMAYELNAVASEFQLAYTRANFLRKVRRQSITSVRVTMVLLKNPAYRAVLEGYLALNQQSSVALEEQAMNTPLNKFPFLYQLWANLNVLSALLQVCAELGYRCVSHNWVKTYRKGTVLQVANDGNAAVQLYNPATGTQINLMSWKPVSEIPEVVANLEAPMALAVAIEAQAKPLEVLLFDPKYEVVAKGVTAGATKKAQSRTKSKLQPEEVAGSIAPVKEDVDELLRFMAQLKEVGDQEVPYAAFLYPGQPMQIATGVEALSARPAHGAVLQQYICAVLRRHLA
ncbi:MAG: DUF2357 domain-containing protein [Cyanobacteria bacterium SZAS-4]|nr:DUF2357 domain-containing protein [Cyanobacteria bacterium SZAS-4]